MRIYFYIALLLYISLYVLLIILVFGANLTWLFRFIYLPISILCMTGFVLFMLYKFCLENNATENFTINGIQSD